MQISIPTASPVHLAQTGNCFPFQKKDLSGLQWHPNTIGIHLFVNYPPLARAEVGAFGLRPSFFLPILHRQAPVFHRLFLICRIFSEKSNFMRIFLQKKWNSSRFLQRKEYSSFKPKNLSSKESNSNSNAAYEYPIQNRASNRNKRSDSSCFCVFRLIIFPYQEKNQANKWNTTSKEAPSNTAAVRH